MAPLTFINPCAASLTFINPWAASLTFINPFTHGLHQIAITTAIGFDSFVVMRNGPLPSSDLPHGGGGKEGGGEGGASSPR